MTMGPNGAQGWGTADASKNPSSCALCPLPVFYLSDSQCPGEAGERSPDERSESQRVAPGHPVSW